MIPLLSSAAMQRADEATIQQFGIPGFTLMESAGRATAQCIKQQFQPRQVNILCGKGNNGGDGLVIARNLVAQGIRTRVVFVGTPEEATPDVRQNLLLLAEIQQKDPTAPLHFWYYSGPEVLYSLPRPDVWVDALLGTGLHSDVREPHASIIQWLNQQSEPIVSVDVPSGLDATTGYALGVAVKARHTYVIAAYKTGLWLGEGGNFTGGLDLLEIGIPAHLIQEQARSEGGAWLPTEKWVQKMIPVRTNLDHKYRVGYLMTLAGSPEMTGAATLCTWAAERVGAGGVICATSSASQAILARKFTTAMTLALPEAPDGGLDPSGLEVVQKRLEKARAMLVGPGLGRAISTKQFIRYWLTQYPDPMVIDADGLTALAESPNLLQKHAQGKWVLTPHWGEFKKLVGDPQLDEAARFSLVRKYAQEWNCVILLKGFPGLVASPDGRVSINPTGNPAAASAGTGDVLAGCVAGLLAQGLPPFEAAVCGYFLAGKASDRYIKRNAMAGMIASDLLEELPRVLYEIQTSTT
ncbi:MAG: NAD(P)H-hydrate dehydratase [Bacteroidetes Order II. Incertae sedis bacterium]|nr:NAD(P)H-hydrate dehydratase [Bacteroidetes Order II. bacterium]